MYPTEMNNLRLWGGLARGLSANWGRPTQILFGVLNRVWGIILWRCLDHEFLQSGQGEE